MKVAEPRFTKPPDRIDLEIVYNDYFLDYTVSDSKKFLIQYLKENNRKEVGQISKVDDWQIGSCGFTARMLSRGCVLSESTIKDMNSRIQELCEPKTKELMLTSDMEKVIIDYMKKESQCQIQKDF